MLKGQLAKSIEAISPFFPQWSVYAIAFLSKLNFSIFSVKVDPVQLTGWHWSSSAVIDVLDDLSNSYLGVRG